MATADDDGPRARSERVLAAMGLEAVDPPRLAPLLALLGRIATRTGRVRSQRLEQCGVAFPLVDRAGELWWERRGCRDRFCPECAAALSRERAGRVREFWAVREAAGARGLFLTATQRKDGRESARAAASRLLASWRAVTRGRGRLSDGLVVARKKGASPLIVGGVRSLEITARAAGAATSHGTRARGGGVHAHLHCLVELAPGAPPATVAARWRRAWLEASNEAVDAAQDVQALSPSNIYQAAKYALDFAALASLADVAPGYAEAVIRGVAGMRMMQPFGSWRGIFGRRPAQAWFGDRSLASLVLRTEGRVRFAGAEVTLDAAEVLATLASPGRRWGAVRAEEREEARERIAWERERAQ